MNDRFYVRYFNKNTKEFEYHKIGAINTKPYTDCTIYEEGQFCTGLHDKNGKLIYEGDLVKQNYNQYIIEGCIGGFHCINTNTKSSYQFCVLSKEHIEVIGNIYENKELLNEYNHI